MEELQVIFDYEKVLGRQASGLEKARIDEGIIPKFQVGDILILNNDAAHENGQTFKVTQIMAAEVFNNWCYLSPWGFFESELNLLKVD